MRSAYPFSAVRKRHTGHAGVSKTAPMGTPQGRFERGSEGGAVELLKVSPLGIDGEMVAIVVAAIGIVLLLVAGLRLAFRSYRNPDRRH